MLAKPFTPPLFILGSPRSFTSLVCAMLGQNPDAYGVPELNLFIEDNLKALIEKLSGYRQLQLHGLLRTVSHLYSGEQTMRSMEMARRWIFTRLERGTDEIYRELCEKVAPLQIVDKSPVYSLRPEYLERIYQAFPEAYYLHLVRHPRTQGESIMNVAKGLMAILSNSIDYSTETPTIDPQIGWYDMQKNILDFLQKIPREKQMRMHGEIVLNQREDSLRKICQWLGMSDDASAIDDMLHPERSPFACLGPVGAHLGNDINFLRSPELRDGQISYSRLEGPLSWRSDGKGFSQEVMEMARDLGYR